MGSKKINKKVFGLIGRNIDYSFSKGYFNKKFRRDQLDNCSYENFDLDSIELLPTVLSHDYISGLNVTIPYKREVIRFLDHLSEPSKKMQAVNTIRFEKDGRTTGHNTDVYGFEESLTKLKSQLPKRALILGSGGASSAVAFVLDKLKIHYQYVSRNPKNDQISYQAVNADLLKNHKLIINASPVGTFPEVDLSPELPYEEINETHIFFDLIYYPT